MNFAKGVAEHIHVLRKEHALREKAKTQFTKEENFQKTILNEKLEFFFNSVEGYISNGEMFTKGPVFLGDTEIEHFLFGNKLVHLQFTNTIETDVYLIGNLNVSDGETYQFKLVYNGNNFYWEYDEQELNEEVFEKLMFDIITN